MVLSPICSTAQRNRGSSQRERESFPAEGGCHESSDRRRRFDSHSNALVLLLSKNSSATRKPNCNALVLPRQPPLGVIEAWGLVVWGHLQKLKGGPKLNRATTPQTKHRKEPAAEPSLDFRGRTLPTSPNSNVLPFPCGMMMISEEPRVRSDSRFFNEVLRYAPR